MCYCCCYSVLLLLLLLLRYFSVVCLKCLVIYLFINVFILHCHSYIYRDTHYIPTNAGPQVSIHVQPQLFSRIYLTGNVQRLAFKVTGNEEYCNIEGVRKNLH